MSELKTKVAELEKLLRAGNNSKPATNVNSTNNNNSRKPALTPLQRKLANTCR